MKPPAKGRKATFRGILLGDAGGTIPDQDDDSFVIEMMERKAYHHDAREVGINQNSSLNDVVENIKQFYEEYNNKKFKKCELNLNLTTEDE